MRRLPTATAVACLALLAAPAGSLAAAQIEAVFLKEYSLPTYTVDQGELVTFANRDPFLEHGVSADDVDVDDAPLFSAPVVPSGSRRLVRGAPFLTEGTYLFHDPEYPEMTAQLEVTAEGEPLPPDAVSPVAAVSVRSASAKTVLRRRKLRVAVTPDEAVDVALEARSGGLRIAAAERTFLSLGKRVLAMKLTKAEGKALSRRVARLRAHGTHRLKVTVSAEVADVAGNPGSAEASHGLRVPAKKRR